MSFEERVERLNATIEMVEETFREMGFKTPAWVPMSLPDTKDGRLGWRKRGDTWRLLVGTPLATGEIHWHPLSDSTIDLRCTAADYMALLLAAVEDAQNGRVARVDDASDKIEAFIDKIYVARAKNNG